MTAEIKNIQDFSLIINYVIKNYYIFACIMGEERFSSM